MVSLSTVSFARGVPSSYAPSSHKRHTNHGGHHQSGHGSSHKGGHDKNPRTGDRHTGHPKSAN